MKIVSSLLTHWQHIVTDEAGIWLPALSCVLHVETSLICLLHPDNGHLHRIIAATISGISG